MVLQRLKAWFKRIVVSVALEFERRSVRLDSPRPFHQDAVEPIRRNNNMKKYIRPIAAALCDFDKSCVKNDDSRNDRAKSCGE